MPGEFPQNVNRSAARAVLQRAGIGLISLIMNAACRLLLTSLLAVLVSTGLIGCSVFSATAAEAQTMHEVERPAAMAGHHHHASHDMAAAPDSAPAHNHDDSSCDGCTQSLLNRISVTPDTAPAPSFGNMPVFVLPVALDLERLAQAPVRVAWPPGKGPPLEPITLTHLKISLLI